MTHGLRAVVFFVFFFSCRASSACIARWPPTVRPGGCGAARAASTTTSPSPTTLSWTAWSAPTATDLTAPWGSRDCTATSTLCWPPYPPPCGVIYVVPISHAFPQLYTAPHVGSALSSAHACWVLIGACNPKFLSSCTFTFLGLVQETYCGGSANSTTPTEIRAATSTLMIFEPAPARRRRRRHPGHGSSGQGVWRAGRGARPDLNSVTVSVGLQLTRQLIRLGRVQPRGERQPLPAPCGRSPGIPSLPPRKTTVAASLRAMRLACRS